MWSAVVTSSGMPSSAAASVSIAASTSVWTSWPLERNRSIQVGSTRYGYRGKANPD
jgi:hypothetical protein